MVISDNISKMYETKKSSADKRMIGFNLTLEEFAAFWQLRTKTVCFYSGKTFNLKAGQDHARYPEIDRIDFNKPYERTNIVFTSKEAHEVKTRYHENGEVVPRGSVEISKHLHRIQKVLSQGFDTAYTPYQEMWAELDKELEVEAAHQKKVDDGKGKVERDIVIADMYVNYSRNIKNAGGDFLLTLSDFKKEITKKCCALTGMELPDGLPSRTLWIKDLTQDVSLGNVMVVNTKTQEALDHLRGSCKMKEEDLVMLGKGLVNLGE